MEQRDIFCTHEIQDSQVSGTLTHTLTALASTEPTNHQDDGDDAIHPSILFRPVHLVPFFQ